MSQPQSVVTQKIDWRSAHCEACEYDGLSLGSSARLWGCYRCLAITRGVKTLLQESKLIHPGARIDDLHLELLGDGVVRIDNARTIFSQLEPRLPGDDPKPKLFVTFYYVNDCGDEQVCNSAVDDGNPDFLVRWQDWSKLKAQIHFPSTSGLEFAANMVQQCCKNHSNCRGQGDNFVPKRLIDVGPSALGAGDIRLIDNAKSILGKGDIEYTALSYCWGEETNQKRDLLRRTNDSIPEMVRGIDSSTLPAVFADAVSTTRHLGLRYLWIDALCIVQGDPVEWAIESTKMAQIYSHAVVTIAAAASKSANESFLDMRHCRKWRNGIEVKASNDCELEFVPKLFVRWEWGTLYERGLLFGFPSKEVSAMDSRAWVMQEALLSRRLLIFEHARVVFTCPQGRFLEDGHRGFRTPTTLRICNFQWWSPVQRAGDSGLSLFSFRRVWKTAVREYSARHLTDYNDRLPGIAGIASMLKSKCAFQADCEYLAGLWKHSFIHELGWYRNNSDDRSVLCGRLQAPSWSWASVPWGVDFDTDFDELRETELRSWSLTRDFGEFGRIGASWVELEGPHLEATLESGESEPTLGVLSQHILPFNLRPPAVRGLSSVTWDFPAEVTDLYNESIVEASENADGCRPRKRVVYLLRLFTCKDHNICSRYLILKKEDNTLDLYSRVGLWTARHFCFGDLGYCSPQGPREAVFKEFDSVQGGWPRKKFVVI